MFFAFCRSARFCVLRFCRAFRFFFESSRVFAGWSDFAFMSRAFCRIPQFCVANICRGCRKLRASQLTKSIRGMCREYSIVAIVAPANHPSRFRRDCNNRIASQSTMSNLGPSREYSPRLPQMARLSIAQVDSGFG